MNGELEEEILLSHTPVFAPCWYCLGGLRRYCMKQAAMACYIKLKGELKGLGFVASDDDANLWV
jgi:hypothetical protein